MTKKELRAIILTAAEQAVKDHQRSDGSNNWLIDWVRFEPKEGYGWFWMKYHAPRQMGRPPSKALAYLGDDVRDAQRQYHRERHERHLRKARS